MSNIALPDAAGIVDTFERVEGSDTVHMQSIVPVDPVTGDPLDLATQTTLAALKTAVDTLNVAAAAIQSAVQSLNTKTTAVNTGAIAGTVALDAPTLAALENTTVSTGLAQPLTDAQIRASALPVTGTVALDAPSLAALETISITGTVPVSGPLTDAQIRASALPISAAALPLPSGAATETTISALQTLLTTIAGTIALHNATFVDGSPGQLILGKRRDGDSTLVADGDLNTFNMDEEGRLKVSSKPASYPDITGDITAVQATIGTPVAGGTVEGDVSRASNIMALCSGTFSTVNVTFEGSLEATGNTNWFGVQAVRSNANTIETATGNLSAQPVYGWELSVNALKRVRVRCTARTSGTQSWRFVQGTYATEPIPAAQVSATQPVSGTVTATVTAGTVNPVVPATPYFVNSAATTNGALVLTGTSGLQSFYATNEGATVAYVKLYNKATAPTVGTDIPEMILPVPAAASGVPGVANPNIGFNGFRFPLGLGIAITGAAVYTDTTAVAAGQVKVKLSRTV